MPFLQGSLPVWLASLIIGRDVLLVGGTVYARFSSLNFKWPGWAEFFSVAAGIPGSKPTSAINARVFQDPVDIHSTLSSAAVSSTADATTTRSKAATEKEGPSGSTMLDDITSTSSQGIPGQSASGPNEGGHDPAPSAPLIKPLFISKLNTCVQLALVAGCLSRSWYEWPPDDVIFLLGATTALTTVGSGAAYLVAYRKGSGTFQAMPGIGPHKQQAP